MAQFFSRHWALLGRYTSSSPSNDEATSESGSQHPLFSSVTPLKFRWKSQAQEVAQVRRRRRLDGKNVNGAAKTLDEVNIRCKLRTDVSGQICEKIPNFCWIAVCCGNGSARAMTGGNGRVPCGKRHGPDLRGLGPIP